MRTNSRLLVASNRLPFTVQWDGSELALTPACGGLAAALHAVHQARDSVWIGWPGNTEALSGAQEAELRLRLRDERVVPVPLSRAELDVYYDGVCNSVLWPVFHYLLDRVPLGLPDFEMYRAVNERFADTIVCQHQRGDTIWIHDYHLLLVPALVRLRLPHASIGFFLHTPFPSADVFKVLPWRREILDGLLGASLLGFQTHRDVVNFADTVRALSEYRVDGSAVIVDDREVRLEAHPIGVDPLRIESGNGQGPRRTDQTALALDGRKLLLGIDRLDYTKGIPRRLMAFERLLDENPDLRGEIELLQVAVPSRTHVPSYVALRGDIERLVASINTRYGSPVWTPVRYLPVCLDARDLPGLYRAADVMLVTSLRDGMNLVAKEFILSRNDEDGVLVLSELAGAADELHEALKVNPYSVEEIARAMATALGLDRDERRYRMRTLRDRVGTRTVETWADHFLSELARAGAPCRVGDEHLQATVRAAATDGQVTSLVLPYEGVLVPQAESSSALRPDPELLALLRALGMRPDLSLHVISGCAHGLLRRWFHGLPATFWAEHGMWCRERDAHRWRRTQACAAGWREDVRELLNQFAARCPGAYVESRGAELIWNFARAERLHGHTQGQMLGALLREAADTLGFAVAETANAISVRPTGLTLERTLQKLLDIRDKAGSVILFDVPRPAAAVRDVLNSGDILVTVGRPDTNSDFSVSDPRAVRALLWNIVQDDPLPAREVATLQAIHPGQLALS